MARKHQQQTAGIGNTISALKHSEKKQHSEIITTRHQQRDSVTGNERSAVVAKRNGVTTYVTCEKATSA